VPDVSQKEKEDAAEEVAATEPQGVVCAVKGVGDEWKNEYYPVQLLDFLHEVNGDVGHEEGEEEPQGWVAVEGTAVPDVFYAEWVYGVFVFGGEYYVVHGVYRTADGAPCEIGHEQVLGFVQTELSGVSGDGFIEETCLEEEEGHEEVGPEHDGLPPSFLVSSYHLYGV
jgi:hypothetical protein